MATIKLATEEQLVSQRNLLWVAGGLLVLFLVLFFIGDSDKGDQDEEETASADAYAGGFPVPPMPTGGAVRGPAAPLTFDRPATSATVSGERGSDV